MKIPPGSNGFGPSSVDGDRKSIINSELWHACAGPLVSIPPVGSLVVYFLQGHSEQVAASMQKDVTSIPSYPSLPSKLICMLHNVTLHADAETDEVYAQMTLQPVNKYDKDALLASEIGLKQNKHPTEFFCKTLTASDTSTHGGFSVPRRAAEKIFPPLDFSMQPPAQELVAKDLHDVSWTFRHIYRGQPKRHLLTTGWSVFVSTKRLFAGDSVLFIRDEKSQLLLGLRRANRQTPALSSSVLSSDSMHIGILAAAAHAAANNSRFTIFYNPRASATEFVVPLAKYNKALYTQVSLGMRFRMVFETEDSGVRRYMGTITGIGDLDPVRWKSSQWRNLQVGWDESTVTERRTRVSLWEIEPVITPFYICPPPFFRPKFPKPDDDLEVENALKRAMPWLNDDFATRETQSSVFPGLSLVQWMAMQQNPQFASSSSYISSAVDNLGVDNTSSRILNFQSQPSVPQNQLQRTNVQVAKDSQQQLQMQLLQRLQNQQIPISRAQSNLTDTDVPSCSTSDRRQDEVVPAVDTLLQELQTRPEPRFKNELRECDQLDASSASSFCLDGSANESFLFPPLCLDNDMNNDGLLGNAVPMMSNDLIGSQEFGGVADMVFRTNENVPVNDNGILSRGTWTGQAPRMRTYTKVQKRGSVGRSIDVTRYRGYDDLRHDLARMFGIEGQLEDPHRTDWKLVYVDHENDILLVGDDPWEEFVACVQSIKILSVTEVQQISFGGELTGIPQNQHFR